MIAVSFDPGELRALQSGAIQRGLTKAIRRATSTSVRDMRSEASKRVRLRKRLKARDVKKALVSRKNIGRTMDTMEWGVDVKGSATRLSDYPHRQVRRGVSVAINKGQRTLVAGAFVATLRSGHKGVFLRRGAKRLPIRELIASRPADALMHSGESERVTRRGRTSFVRTLDRLLSAELDKAAK